MSEDARQTLGNIIKSIGSAVEKAATLQVETWYVLVGESEVTLNASGEAEFRKAAKPLAQTTIKIDADSINVVPMRKGSDGTPVIDEKLLELHNRSVQTARQYRADVMETLERLIREAIRQA